MNNDSSHSGLGEKEEKKQEEKGTPNSLLKEGAAYSEEIFYNALGHKIRREIIKLIGENGKAGFSNIKKKVKASTGTIYHHIEILEDLIYQDGKKKYHLTDLGQHAFESLDNNIKTIRAPTESEDFDKQIIQKADGNDREKDKEENDGIPKHNVLGMQSIFDFFIHNPTIGSLLSMLIISTVALIASFLNVSSYLFFFSPNASNFTREEGVFRLNIFLSVIGGALIVIFSIELLCRFVLDKKKPLEDLITVIGIPYIPTTFYLVLMVFFKYHDLVGLRITLLIVFQVWSMILLAQSIKMTKNVSFERSFLISLFLDYGAFFVILLIKNPL